MQEIHLATQVQEQQLQIYKETETELYPVLDMMLLMEEHLLLEQMAIILA